MLFRIASLREKHGAPPYSVADARAALWRPDARGERRDLGGVGGGADVDLRRRDAIADQRLADGVGAAQRQRAGEVRAVVAVGRRDRDGGRPAALDVRG